MGAFSIWHWAIVLLVVGVPVFFAIRSAAKPAEKPAALVGFGGWLLLLAIGQTLSPLRSLVELGSSSEGYQQLMLLPNGPLTVYGEIGLLLVFLLLQVVVLVAMWRRSPRFKQLFLYQWMAIPVVFILDTVWVSIVLGAPMSQVLTGDAVATPILSFVLTGIWVAYVYKSVRVRNTFGGAAASTEVATAS
ncbi:DUF2569 family protein [Mesorhizobium sp. 131-2-1]|uniref:DUF2569 family protein n=1 Tax=Mesorhizobium sp. 131-2-1 TaxID=2744518 RepID=UPI0019285FA2|nr:DUF2569 family protein [Mesorhizobium sp. 131-2-1]BCG94447.1 hypothetical protein MesoLj131a_33110 [Mesorhizobium sp. 131-2-1]